MLSIYQNHQSLNILHQKNEWWGSCLNGVQVASQERQLEAAWVR